MWATILESALWMGLKALLGRFFKPKENGDADVAAYRHELEIKNKPAGDDDDLVNRL